MKRRCLEKLIEWKSSPRRKPLLLLGARQVGKTWLMREFGKNYYTNVVYVRFDKDQFIKESFSKDFDTKRLLQSLHLHTGEKIIPGKTLIILDEIQECPAALTALKYFCEDNPEQHIISAGSLLGLEEHVGTGFPVGKVNRIYLHPMSFTEFLNACGYDRYAELLKQRDWEMIQTFREKYETLLRTYLYVGGMPEAVAEYINSRDMQAVRKLQLELLEDYRNDFSKHATPTEQHLISEIWRHIPEHLASEDKRFVPSSIVPGTKAEKLRGPIRWLQDAGMINIVHRVRKPEIPLDAYAELAFKMYFLDVGLLAARCKIPASILLENNNIFMQFKGALTEQYVLQQLISDCELTAYYWTAERAQAEIDFLIQTEDGQTIPIEVKAERNLRAKSLHSFCKRFSQQLALRTSMSHYEANQINLPQGTEPSLTNTQYTLVDLPLYAISLLRETLEQHRPS